ncbi:MAG: DUF4342 domain-containing protein [Chloroflexota bacterium]|nr:MAG: DUF4342 domain-containing protein [Chloroflexota bacterium]
MSEQRGSWEEIKVSGGQLVNKVMDLIHEGNVRRIHIRQDGRTVLELPLTLATIGALIAPALAILGGIAAVATNCSIAIEREERSNGPQQA